LLKQHSFDLIVVDFILLRRYCFLFLCGRRKLSVTFKFFAARGIVLGKILI